MNVLHRLRRIVQVLLAALLIAPFAGSGLCAAAAASAAPPPSLAVRIAPHSAGGAVDYVAVHLEIQSPAAPAGTAFLHMPEVFASVESEMPAELKARDADGALPLKALDNQRDESGFISYRRWAATRASHGDVTVDYRIRARVFIPKLGAGPPFDLRPEAGGINGAGDTFLLLPAAMTPSRITLSWDLSSLPAEARGVSSFGEGTIHTVGPALVLAHAYYAAGVMRRFPDADDGRFHAYWQTDSYLDLKDVSAFTQKAFDVISKFYGDDTSSYRVIFRKNAYPGRGGAMLNHSFLVGFGDEPRQSAEGMKLMLAHETVHTWPESLDGPNGEVAWYGEGMAEYYSATLMLRAGLIDADTFLDEINERAQRYYTNAVNTIPATEIGAAFWKDGRVRQISYDRGSFYMAMVNAEIRSATNGRKSLDDVALAMMARKRAGESYDTDAWLTLLRGILGPRADAEFQAMQEGKVLDPPADVFGRCFARTSVAYRQFDLGFDPASLLTLPRVVKGLVPGSAAAIAGLKNGDVLAAAVSIEEAESADGKPLTVPVVRGGKTVAITYVPRGKKVPGYRWVRAPDSPDTGCTY